MTKKRSRRNDTPERQLFQETPLHLVSITEEERFFLREWCQARNLGENYIVVATTYWLRCKSHAYASFLMFVEAKRIYMVLCVHLALKHLGYDELHACDFLADLREIYPSLKPEQHRAMEWELFRYLNFDMGA